MSTGWAIALGLLAGLFLLAHLRPGPTLRAVRDAFGVPIGLLGDLAEGLGRLLGQARGFWRESFGEAFGMRPLLGGALKLSFAILFTVAEFELLRLGMEVVLRLVVVARPLPIFGEETVAGLAAYAGVGLALMLADGVLELSGVAEFLRWRLSPKARKVGTALCMAGLLIVCAIEAAVGVLRVLEMRNAELQAALTQEEVLGVAASGQAATPPSASAHPGWIGFWDSLPLGIQGAFGFLVPLVAGLLGAVALHPVILGLAGLAVALPIGLVVLMAGMVRLLLNLLARIAAFCESALSVAAPHGLQPTPEAYSPEVAEPAATPNGDFGRGAEATRSDPNAPAARQSQAGDVAAPPRAPISMTTPRPGNVAAPPSRGSEQAGEGLPQGDSEDLEALAEALVSNPLDVPEELLRDRRDGEGGRRP